MHGFDYQPTIRVLAGAGTLSKLASLAAELTDGPVLVVTDPGVERAGIAGRVVNYLKAAGRETIVFTDVAENPTTKHVEAAVAVARHHASIRLIIGVGGGSAMDCAKGTNFLLTNGGCMEDYRGRHTAIQPMLPSIGIPTTAGTGSEAQSFALIARTDTHEKMACGDIKARFRTVILDPELSLSAPNHVTAIAGLDAIAHTIESHVSTARNAISDMYTRQAWRLLSPAFPKVLNRPEDLEPRSAMLVGAHLAGAAIENAMLGAAHAGANPLTAHCGIPHGIAVSILLPGVVNYNAAVVGPLYTELLETSHLSDPLDRHLANLVKAAGIPTRLREYDVEDKLFPVLAREAADQWTARYNPRPLGVTDFLKLYESAY